MHALCAHAQGSVDLHVESYGVAGPLVETLYNVDLSYIDYTQCANMRYENRSPYCMSRIKGQVLYCTAY